jgi:hypothetical protein
MAKKIAIGTKPAAKLDDWVAAREEVPVTPEPISAPAPTPTLKKAEPPVKMKRLTLDISEELHRAIKRRSVDEGKPMVDMLRELLEQNFL